GRLKLNKKNGTAQLEVSLPGAGALTAVDAAKSAAKTSATKKKKKALIKNASLSVAAAGVAKLNLKPTGAGKKKLKEKGKLAFNLTVTSPPTGETAASQVFKGTLKQTKKKG